MTILQDVYDWVQLRQPISEDRIIKKFGYQTYYRVKARGFLALQAGLCSIEGDRPNYHPGRPKGSLNKKGKYTRLEPGYKAFDRKLKEFLWRPRVFSAVQAHMDNANYNKLKRSAWRIGAVIDPRPGFGEPTQWRLPIPGENPSPETEPSD